MATIRDLMTITTTGLDRLAGLGEEIADEWQYVTDLSSVYRARLAAVATERGDEAVDDEALAAVQTAVEEAGLVTDPHRAIDWLSTLPQVALLVVGETA